MVKIGILFGSARPASNGRRLVKWIQGELGKIPAVSGADFVDPARLELPLLVDRYEAIKNSPACPPALHELQRRLKSCDGFMFITPEYNHTLPPALTNTLDYFLSEYTHKPVGICSYSMGTFGGARAGQDAYAYAHALGMVAIPKAFLVPTVQKALNESGEHDATSSSYPHMADMFKPFAEELVWYTETLTLAASSPISRKPVSASAASADSAAFADVDERRTPALLPRLLRVWAREWLALFSFDAAGTPSATVSSFTAAVDTAVTAIGSKLLHPEDSERLWIHYRRLATATDPSLYALRLLADSSNRHALTFLLDQTSRLVSPQIALERFYSVMRDLDVCGIPLTDRECGILVDVWDKAGFLADPLAATAATKHIISLALSRSEHGLVESLGRRYARRKYSICVISLIHQWYTRIAVVPVENGHRRESAIKVVNNSTLVRIFRILAESNCHELALSLFESQKQALNFSEFNQSDQGFHHLPFDVYYYCLLSISHTLSAVVNIRDDKFRSMKKMDVRLGNVDYRLISKFGRTAESVEDGPVTEVNLSTLTVGLGLFREALEIYPTPLRNEKTRHHFLFNVMIQIAAKHSNSQIVEELLTEMKNLNMPPPLTATLCAVVAMQLRILCANTQRLATGGENSPNVNQNETINAILTTISRIPKQRQRIAMYEATMRAFAGIRRFNSIMRVLEEVSLSGSHQYPGEGIKLLRKESLERLIIKAAEAGRSQVVYQLLRFYESAGHVVGSDLREIVGLYGIEVNATSKECVEPAFESRFVVIPE
ncbi:hypothetical protein HDU82_001115 [Entophlyctis luteolus]|nr:hypothetical protein HDU82_001115 [Entophlyctis luteolus]KAJ3389634.1 hypothetical protein HDU84_008555 [Entophlyctis sp. JEL0112]